MITYYTIITFLFFHWLFDFFFQTETMSKNKSKDNNALCEHVFVYSIGLFLMSVFNAKFFNQEFLGGFITYSGIFITINVTAHFVTDWVTSRATSALYKEERYHDFFVVIGVDQMIHYITLFGTFIWLTNLRNLILK